MNTKKLQRRVVFYCAVSLLLTQLPNSSRAVVRTWANVGTTWNVGTNWGGTAPVAGDTAKFDSAASVQPNLTASASVNNLLFSTAGASGYDITSTSTSVTLTLTSTTNTGGASGTAAITGVSTGTNTIDAPIVLGAAASSNQYFTNAGTLVFNGVMTNANSGIILNLGTTGGNYQFNGANTFTSTATINQNAGNTLVIGNSAAFGSATLKFSSNSGQIQAGTDLTGSNKVNSPLVFSSTTSTETIANSGTFGIEFGGNTDLGGGAVTLTSAISGGATFDGVISNDAGGGFGIVTTNFSLVTLKGTNTYTGNTTTSGTGRVSVAAIGNSGATGNLGKGTAINLGSTTAGGTLVYTGTGETTSKVLNLNGTTGGATVDQSGTSGVLKFSVDLTATGANSKTLLLQGSTNGTGEIAGRIVDNSAANKTSVSKAGTGTWTLSGANPYTGTTSVTGGTLLVNGSTSTASAVTVSAGTLGGTGTVGGTVGVSSGGKVSPGSGLAVGNLTTGALTLQSGSTFNAFVAGDGMASQLLASTTTAASGALFSITLPNGATFANADNGLMDVLTLIPSNFSGTFTNSYYTVGGYNFIADYSVSGIFSVDVTPVPEPATVLGGLLTAGLLGGYQRRRLLGWIGRRRAAVR